MAKKTKFKFKQFIPKPPPQQALTTIMKVGCTGCFTFSHGAVKRYGLIEGMRVAVYFDRRKRAMAFQITTDITGTWELKETGRQMYFSATRMFNQSNLRPQHYELHCITVPDDNDEHSKVKRFVIRYLLKSKTSKLKLTERIEYGIKDGN